MYIHLIKRMRLIVIIYLGFVLKLIMTHNKFILKLRVFHYYQTQDLII